MPHQSRSSNAGTSTLAVAGVLALLGFSFLVRRGPAAEVAHATGVPVPAGARAVLANPCLLLSAAEAAPLLGGLRAAPYRTDRPGGIPFAGGLVCGYLGAIGGSGQPPAIYARVAPWREAPGGWPADRIAGSRRFAVRTGEVAIELTVVGCSLSGSALDGIATAALAKAPFVGETLPPSAAWSADSASACAELGRAAAFQEPEVLQY